MLVQELHPVVGERQPASAPQGQMAKRRQDGALDVAL
jgi:hypothetical protein